jgi:hypothetical protein
MLIIDPTPLPEMTVTWIIFWFCAYFFPTGAGLIRKHPAVVSIFLLNFFLGWTFFGWIAALVWAFKPPSMPVQIVNQVINNVGTTPHEPLRPAVPRPAEPAEPRPPYIGSRSDGGWGG